MRHLRRRLTYANVMSTLCLFLVLGGVSYAAATLPRNSVGAAQLKANSVTSAKIGANQVKSLDIAANSVLGADIKESTLDKVPTAAKADSATNADLATKATTADLATKATSADSATSVTGLKALAVTRSTATSGANAAAAEAAAPETVLYTKGQVSVTAKCYTDTSGPTTTAAVYAKTTTDGAIFSSNRDSLAGGAATDFLQTTTTNGNREIAYSTAAAGFGAIASSDPEDGLFAIVGVDGTALQGTIIAASKNGAPAGGNGAYSAGDSCIFYGSVLSS